ncbi:MAG: phosphodiester glycosidase family protein [Synechococcaceae cyanobacterium]|nr:phosphodiester glycosidase family protein [Synechococcaceae cyanobacterium]
MTSWTVLGAALLAATPVGLGGPPLPPPPPVQPDIPVRISRDRPEIRPQAGDWGQLLAGGRLSINGRDQRAGWRWGGGRGPFGQELWLPLEVLQGQLGFSSRTGEDGSLAIEWFGQGRLVSSAEQRAIADEVAVEVGSILAAAGVRVSAENDRLRLELPPTRVVQVRSADQPGRRRVVLDLAGPATLDTSDGRLRLDVESLPRDLTARLASLGLPPRRDAGGLSFAGSSIRSAFTLGTPPRVVIDLPATTATAEPSNDRPVPIDPRLQALLGGAVQWDRQVMVIGSRRLRLISVSFDPRGGPLGLKPLSRPDGMQGLTPLALLARHHDALVAVNGGYFNRVLRLPLGALRTEGRWQSGPILNRGVVAWEPRALPRFGRLQLEEWLTDGSGRRYPLLTVNSGWVQRGLSRYTADWGPVYRALSGNETALLLRGSTVAQRLEAEQLRAGIPLAEGDMLLVARGGQPLPWAEGDNLTLSTRPSNELGLAANVVGGGPLLLLDGRVVLDGAAESFGNAFLSQGAPRTVIGSDGQRLWLLTLQGVEDEGPTLAETAVLLQRLGLRDALNLDGGSSTGLIMGGNHTVKGRGVAGVVHNGLGLVQLSGLPPRGDS